MTGRDTTYLKKEITEKKKRLNIRETNRKRDILYNEKIKVSK